MKNRISYGKSISESGTDIVVCPAFCDVHVHFREPGRPDKETILTGCRAAVAGGYTAVCTMPNLDPAPDSIENLEVQLEIIRRDAFIDVIPYAAITGGRKGVGIVDMHSLKSSVIAFSDDGSGVQDDALMLKAMETAAAEDCIIAAHCEDNRFGILPEGEWRQIERDLKLAEMTGCRYHVCHISTKESVGLIRRAKDRGVNVSCETAPHYIVLCDEDRTDDGRFKMNPPLRTAADREAIREGLIDGTIDMIATDHAPHTAAEKSLGFAGSAFGIVGLETAFPVLYTSLVRCGILSLEKLVELMSTAPRRRFGIGPSAEDYAVFDIADPYRIDSCNFRSKGRSTPFEGMEVYGRCLKTVHNGTIVYEAGNI